MRLVRFSRLGYELLSSRLKRMGVDPRGLSALFSGLIGRRLLQFESHYSSCGVLRISFEGKRISARAMKETIFISSVQKELQEERRAIKDYVQGDPLLWRFFDVFLFEDLPASDRRADEVYLDQVDRCGIYIGLYGTQYGIEDEQGLSPTEREFNRATEKGKVRLIFIKGTDDRGRHPRMRTLLRKAGAQVIRRRFGSVSELTALVYASMVDFLERRGIIQERPFDERLCLDATLDDLDGSAVREFVRQARHERQFPLQARTPISEVLTHLGLFRESRLTNAAILLFGRNPQRFIPCAEVRCMHFHGTEIQRPAPFYRIFKGNLFTQVDQAANFVLSVTNLSVGTRLLGPQAPIAHEIPPDVIREAIVNAVAHRDYTSGAAVQVAVFADRIEVWNPGELLPPLTPNSLREPHRSIVRNHRICESLFLAGYIEKYGTGTLMMIRESVEHELAEPDFEQRGGEFVITVWRDWLTERVLAAFNLNDRQSRAIGHIKITGLITSKEYQELTGAIPRTTTRDLDDLVGKRLLKKVGRSGRGAHYVLCRKSDKNRTNRTFPTGAKSDMNRTSAATAKGSQRAQSARYQGGRKKATHEPNVSAAASPDGTKLALSWHQLKVLEKCREETVLIDLMAIAQRADRTKFRHQVLSPLLINGLVEMTVPDKPRSSKQKYRLTAKGRAWLAVKNPP